MLESESNFNQQISTEALDMNCNHCTSVDYIPVSHKRTTSSSNQHFIGFMSHSSSSGSTLEQSDLLDNENEHSLSFDLANKGINIGHLNIQGICGDKLSKFSELKVLLTSPANSNLHIFGLSSCGHGTKAVIQNHKSINE